MPAGHYRCPVCLREFLLDVVTKKLTLAALLSTEPPVCPKAVTHEHSRSHELPLIYAAVFSAPRAQSGRTVSTTHDE